MFLVIQYYPLKSDSVVTLTKEASDCWVDCVSLSVHALVHSPVAVTNWTARLRQETSNLTLFSLVENDVKHDIDDSCIVDYIQEYFLKQKSDYLGLVRVGQRASLKKEMAAKKAKTEKLSNIAFREFCATRASHLYHANPAIQDADVEDLLWKDFMVSFFLISGIFQRF